MKHVLMIWFFALSGVGAVPPKAEVIDAPIQKILDQHGFVITGETLRQGFSPYIGGRYPAFVTSDSLLMAYTTILERVIADQQRALMGAHIDLVREMAKNMPKEDAGLGASETRLLIGCMHHILLGWVPGNLTGQEAKLVAAESKRVMEAAAMHPPSWWGDQSYMPYSSFQPTSPWSQSEILSRYFRYRQWMQSLPLITENKKHMWVCESLHSVLDNIDYTIKQHALDGNYTGEEDDGMLGAIDGVGYVDIDNGRKTLTGKLKPLLRDRRHFLSPEPTPEKKMLTQALQESEKLHGLTNHVGWLLGSRVAEIHQPATKTPPAGKELQKEMLENVWHGHGRSLLKALYALNKRPDPRAPELFASDAWQRKQLNCSMAAWAEYRHAIAITQTTSRHWMCAFDDEPGFIEPVPEFYQYLGKAAEQLTRLAQANQKQMQRYQATMLALKFETMIKQIRAIRVEETAQGTSIWGNPMDLERTYGELLKTLFKKEVPEGSYGMDAWNLQQEKDRTLLIQKMEATCKKFWAQDPETKKLFDAHSGIIHDEVTHRVIKLEALCYRLEAMCRKQLAKQAWSADEASFIKNYGTRIGYLMFYEGNSYVSPRDDAPRLVQIAHLGSPAGEQILQCGTARPRKMLIYYPSPKGKNTLCIGSVYSYREIIGSKSISDEQWRKECEKIHPPGWMKNILGED